MRVDQLPRRAIGEQLNRLSVTFGGTKPDFEAFTHEIQLATAGWSEAEFVSAISDCIRSCIYFPRIKNILENRPLAPVAHRQDDAGTHSACGRCGVVPYVAGYENFRGVVPRIRCDCEPLAGFLTPAAQLATRACQEDYAREVYAILDGENGVSASLRLLVEAGNAPRGATGTLADALDAA